MCPSIKHHFSQQHFRAAEYFAREAGKVESLAENGEQLQERMTRHRAYVTGAVLSGVAFLESSINELFLDAIDSDPHRLKGMSNHNVELLAESWEDVKMGSTLLKYQTALLITNSREYEKGTSPYQDADLLIRLRNALLHYKPEWSHEPDEPGSLEKMLAGRFPSNQLSSSNALWFPHRCLGCGCAEWGVKVSRSFMIDFSSRMNIPSRLPRDS